MKRILFTVTNDLNYDQRMIRIAGSLAAAGYQVTLTGCSFSHSLPLEQKLFEQKRLSVSFKKGSGFYAFYNIRLFFHLLFVPCDIICAIDLDTILPVWLAGKLRGKQLVYDAHEYFSQQKEVISRPGVYRIWHWIERRFVPHFKNGYTVSQSIAAEFQKLYGVAYELVRNLPLLSDQELPSSSPSEKFVLYQGAVNEARGLEYLVPAMKQVPISLHIYGDGNFVEQTKGLIAANNLGAKVLLKGKRLPAALESFTREAYIGLNLVENNGLNQYYSLANKFFDYIHAGVPQVSMNFPEYRAINEQFEVAVLIDELTEESIAAAINRLVNDEALYQRLQQNCMKARLELNWQQESKKLLAFYEKLKN